ncbi:MAG: glycosyltransferase family 39 protein [Planctomycetes bacterium]|nr:glycosyltransferase family 39 protein [Planctomycetota bacterium]
MSLHPYQLLAPGKEETAAPVLAILCLLFALGIGALRPVGGFDTAEADFYGAYAPQALRLLNGEPYTWTRSGPGYSVLLAIGGWLGFDLFAFAKVAAAVGVAVIGYSTFLLGRELFSPRAALCAQAAVQIASFRYGIQAGNDVPCAAFSLASLVCLTSTRAPTSWRLGLAGGFAGCAAVTRYPALALLFAALPAILVWQFVEARFEVRLRLALLYVGGFLVTSGPWWVWNTATNGSPLASKAYALVALESYGKSGTQVSQSHLAEMESRFSSFSDVLLHDPVRWLTHLPEDLYGDAAQFLTDVVTWPWAIGLGLGFAAILGLTDRQRRGVATLLLSSLFAFLLVAIAPYQSRYHLSVAPTCFLVAAASFGAPGMLRLEAGLLRKAAWLWVVVALGVLGGTSVLLTKKVVSDSPGELLHTAEVLRAHATPNDGIVVRKPHLALLAGLQPRFSIEGVPAEQFFAWVRSDPTTRFVYVGPRELSVMPDLTALAKGDAPPNDFEVLDRTMNPATVLLRRRPD